MSTDVFPAQATLTKAALSQRAQIVGAKTIAILKHASSPRGRADRRGLLAIALGFLAAQFLLGAALHAFGVQPSLVVGLLLNAPILWIGYATTVKRLHDVGRSAWMVPLAVGFWIASTFVVGTIISTVAYLVIGAHVIQPGSWLHTALFFIIALPAFGGLIWLHTAPGSLGDNRYGAPTGELGFSTPAKSDIIG